MNRTVKDFIGNRPVLSVNGFSDVSAAAGKIDGHMSAIGVVTNGKFEGVFSESSVFHKITRKNLASVAMNVKQAMTKAEELPSVAPETKMLDVLDLMNENKLSHVPILDGDGKFLGLLSRTDALSIADNEIHEGSKVVDEMEEEYNEAADETSILILPKQKVKDWIQRFRQIFENSL